MTEDELVILTEPRPSRADALKNRARLLEVAGRLFAEQGIEAVSMTAIAEAAGVGKGTLYRHFENKNELTLALLDHDQRELQERTFDRLRTSFDVRADLHWFLVAVLDFVVGHATLLKSGVPSPDLNVMIHPAHLWWRQTIRGLLERIALDGAGDLDYASDVLYLMLNVHTVEFQRDFLHYDVERIRAGLLATLGQLID